MKNPFYTWLAPAFTLAVTVLVFMLFKSESPSAIFWMNMIYTLCLELLCFAWLHCGGHNPAFEDRQSSPFRFVVGISTLYYIIAAVVWMIIATLLNTHGGQKLLTSIFSNSDASGASLAVRIYLLGAFVITIIWILFNSASGRHDSSYAAQHESLEKSTADVRSFAEELKNLKKTHSTPESAREWKALIRDVESTPPAQFASRFNQFQARKNKLIQ